jgi:glycosyltransferase involved in cell wall biosynthesis
MKESTPSPRGGSRVAIVHHWYLHRRGGERVFDAIAGMFPEADLFFLVCNHDALPASLRSRRITCSFLQRVPFAQTRHRYLMPLYPAAVEALDLSDYDLVISSDSGPVKGVLTRPDALHICYCHSPMRYAWDMYHRYLREPGRGIVARALFAISAHYVRQWDLAASSRVDYFVANSLHVAKRIEKFYRRDAKVIYPPVELPATAPSNRRGDYYLFVGQLVDYKRADLAIRACNALRRKLLVVGDGEQARRLKALAGPTIEFAGKLSDTELCEAYAGCRALLFPGEEDFGMVPLEAHSYGKPVIAYGRGGALETVVDVGTNPGAPATGVFFAQPTEASLINAIQRFESIEHDLRPEDARRRAALFSADRFRREFLAVVRDACAARQIPLPGIELKITSTTTKIPLAVAPTDFDNASAIQTASPVSSARP